ncbi:glycosyltransferase [Thermosynechococcus sp. PP45]|nr:MULTISPECIES: glycosyltransferase [unclassified Thermosynechococcus]WKT80094.1 glycosyltransferase [Thermosynechococcus sp. PP45]WNC23704.1 glycosyltransferase [Thermosynechococcus sp. PP551]WNC26280.1 glycosyltransferase [Thermosynechococcus sp. PP555]
MAQPLVSIGLPVRNGGPLLDEALDLLRRQTCKNIEIIV